MSAEPVLVVGSVALDTVETPAERREEVLGGSATYFAYAASFFAPVRLVGVVGEDFPDSARAVLAERDIDLAGLVTKPGHTFRWSGRYAEGMNERETLEVHLNVFGEHTPEVPEVFRRSPYLFLANCRPAVQRAILESVESYISIICSYSSLVYSTPSSCIRQYSSSSMGGSPEVVSLCGFSSVARAVVGFSLWAFSSKDAAFSEAAFFSCGFSSAAVSASTLSCSFCSSGWG